MSSEEGNRLNFPIIHYQRRLMSQHEGRTVSLNEARKALKSMTGGEISLLELSAYYLEAQRPKEEGLLVKLEEFFSPPK